MGCSKTHQLQFRLYTTSPLLLRRVRAFRCNPVAGQVYIIIGQV